ncbi:type II toxin-antitoxin system RelE/ParE family toxin [Amorphus orientalis]|uniref:Proteic killer suppression protein n=1 Tax=Amorphus orientalis TaxID=649198 RepID=A0AAE3VRD9_9HYPH|nr:type II toxin-antitoxin system RelE/ParE family toxin [Amorphus orientalis]MDQ0316763.1 proteic killer suppression protein [Amorphus orientalis]
MIVSFRHKGLKRFYERGDASRLPADQVERIRDILTVLDTAEDLDTIARPSFRLHPLKGSRRGQWAVTVRANWRIVFRFEKPNVIDVDLEDYH